MLWAFQLKQVSFSTSVSELEETEDRKALAPKYIYIFFQDSKNEDDCEK